MQMCDRFRSFLPVVIDVETAGFNHQTDALLEVAVVILRMDDSGFLEEEEAFQFNVQPFEGANIEPAALKFTGIDPFDENRQAVLEKDALNGIFQPIRSAVKRNLCTRAIMVAHNAHFDLGFINSASERCEIKRNPFHPFSCFDTGTLAGLAYGQTVLSKACAVARIDFDDDEAHNAAYDARKTAALFCNIVNRWNTLGGLR